MPNWITNEIKASPEVISSIVNEGGHVDFELMMPFPGTFEWNFVSCSAEQAAEVAAGKPLDSHPLIASLQAQNRKSADITKLSDEDFEQFVQMLRNYRKCGFLHSMDFARDSWGTKWNACESKHDIGAGTAKFETAWSCPVPVLLALSKRFPNEQIKVVYADEDIGSNCGTFTFLNGEKIESDEAPPWSKQTDQEKKKWTEFACHVKGRDPSEYAE